MASDHNPFADPFGDPSVTAAASSTPSALGGGGGGTAYGDAYHNPFESASPTITSAYGAEPKRSSTPKAATAAAPLLASRGVEVEMKPKVASASRASASGLTEDDLHIREQNLLRREKELADRERDIDQKVRDGKMQQADNWPSKCYPLAYHSIPTEIPEAHRPFVRKFYAMALFTWLCIFFNWFTFVIGWLIQPSTTTDISGSDALWSSIYLVIGIPGSWKLWYRSLYYAFRDKSTGKWVVFFISYFAHICFSVIMGLGVPDCAGAGFFVMTKLFVHHQSLTGIFALCNLSIWGLNGLISVVLLKSAHATWKSGGGATDLKKQVAQAAMAEAVNQKLAEGESAEGSAV